MERKLCQFSQIAAVLVIVVSLLPFGCSLEEYQREIFLAPRNFNPHPYEHQLAKIQDPGPVVFPRAEGEQQPAGENVFNIITVDNPRTKHPIDQIPYRRVAEKVKYLISRKYSRPQVSQVDPAIYNDLYQQEAKLISYPTQQLDNYGTNLQKKNYAFAYKVLDKATGDDFSHQQIRSSKATNGEYRVKLPDGRLQIVSYKADKDGYKADVKYENDPEAVGHQIVQTPRISRPVYVPQKVQVSSVPVRQFGARGRVKAATSYDYITDESDHNVVQPQEDPHLVILDQYRPTQVPVSYANIEPQSTPKSAYYIQNIPSNEVQHEHHPNVQLYTTNARDHLQGSYIPTTSATPQYEKQLVRYVSTPLPPTVQAHLIHNGDNGLYNPSLGSTASPQSAAPPGHKNVINTLAPANNQNEQYRQTLEQENNLPEGIYIVGKSGK
ncbi:uncharacterized protein LOC109538811 [Dendroctonus ponderosae]|uniref:uncharacterized protein LOC109538811 n=1 Tax=Dendroctonus ponderosae TaxID=77166 RepID=UPI002035F55F|nr:uncharacterized protein LOC109538811 [Dendroctonus ponderosae]